MKDIKCLIVVNENNIHLRFSFGEILPNFELQLTTDICFFFFNLIFSIN